MRLPVRVFERDLYEPRAAVNKSEVNQETADTSLTDRLEAVLPVFNPSRLFDARMDADSSDILPAEGFGLSEHHSIKFAEVGSVSRFGHLDDYAEHIKESMQDTLSLDVSSIGTATGVYNQNENIVEDLVESIDEDEFDFTEGVDIPTDYDRRVVPELLRVELPLGVIAPTVRLSFATDDRFLDSSLSGVLFSLQSNDSPSDAAYIDAVRKEYAYKSNLKPEFFTKLSLPKHMLRLESAPAGAPTRLLYFSKGSLVGGLPVSLDNAGTSFLAELHSAAEATKLFIGHQSFNTSFSSPQREGPISGHVNTQDPRYRFEYEAKYSKYGVPEAEST